jgi:bacterioferritin-associated ferredoxin
MYICLCNAITERQVQAVVASGASTMSELQGALGVATTCGCCLQVALEYLPGGLYATPGVGVVAAASLTSEVNEFIGMASGETAANDETVRIGAMQVSMLVRSA